MINPLATLIAKATTKTGMLTIGALTIGIGGYILAGQGCRSPFTSSPAQVQAVQPSQSPVPLIVTNTPRSYTNSFPAQQPQLAVGAKKTTLENIASILREGETFVVGTNKYALTNQLNWVLYKTNELAVKVDESGSYLYSAPFVGVPTLVTNKDGTPWRRAMPLATNGTRGITARLEFVQQTHGTNEGVGMQARIKQSRPLLSWKLEGTNYHLPTGDDGTNIYAIKEGPREYHANGAVAPNNYTWLLNWIPESQWLSQRPATNTPALTTNAPVPLGTAGTVSVPTNP